MPDNRPAGNPEIHRLSTVIPAQAGIQKIAAGNWIVFVNTFLDSRLRGNDGRGKPAGMTAPGVIYSPNPAAGRGPGWR